MTSRARSRSTPTARRSTRTLNRTLARNSIEIGLLSAIFSVALALPVAYWLRYATGRWRMVVLFLITASMFASYLVRIYAWRTMLGEHGVVNSALESLGIIDQPLGFLIFNRFAVTVALVHIFLPYAVLVLFAGFQPIRPGLLEAAQDLGAGAVPALAAGDPAARRGAGAERVPVRVRALGLRLRHAAVRRRLERRDARRAGAGQLHDRRQLPAGRRHVAAHAGGVRRRSTSRSGSACGSRSSTGCASRDRALPRRARDHDRGPAVPVRAAGRRGAVLVPQDGLAVAPVHGLLAALVPLRALRPGLPLGAREQPVRGRLDRGHHAAAGHARLVRDRAHRARGCAARSRCSSSCPSRCPACSSASRCSCSSCA